MQIDYSDIPGNQNLFLDYVFEYENVSEFYPKHFQNEIDFLKTFDALSSYDRPHRREISDILLKQYQIEKYSKLTESNISALKSNRTFAVLTGQQATIFGGPLYTIYKTITAIKLAQQLKEKYSSYNFVPIFWMEVDDHDFDEVSSTKFFDSENNIRNINYDDGESEEIDRGSVGNIKFNKNIKYTLADLDDALKESEFKEEILILLNSFYTEGKTFKYAFRKLLISLFDEYGLIVFDPQDSSAKNILLPIFEKEINNFEIHRTKNVLTSAELEEVYHAQVKVKPVNLFFSDKTGRHLIEPTENGFKLKGRRKKFSKEELLNLLYFDPTPFSPNVLLRPICQDFLFPTAAYVGGSSEISYFAQVMPNYDFFGVVSPIIFPRSSATIVENHIGNSLAKCNLEMGNMFIEKEILIEKAIKAISNFNLDELFLNSESKIKAELNNISEELLKLDISLQTPINKTLRNIENSLLTLRDKANHSEKLKHQNLISQIEKIRKAIYPNENMQEREINIFYFINKYGFDIIKWIMNELKTNVTAHQILEI